MKRAPGIRGKPKFQSKLPPATLEDLANARKLKDFGKYSGKNQMMLDSEFSTSSRPNEVNHWRTSSEARNPSILEERRSLDVHHENAPKHSEDVTSSESPEQNQEDSDEDWGYLEALSSRKTNQKAKSKKVLNESSCAFVVHAERNKPMGSKNSFGLFWTAHGSAVSSDMAVSGTGEMVSAGMWVSVRYEKRFPNSPTFVTRIFRILEDHHFQVEEDRAVGENPKLIVNLIIGENTHSDMESFFIRHNLCSFIRIKVEYAKGQGGKTIRVLIRRLQNPIKVPESKTSVYKVQEKDLWCYWEVEKVVSSSEGRRLQDSDSVAGSGTQNLRIMDGPRNLENQNLNPSQIQNPRTLWNSGSSRPSGPDTGRVHPNFPGTGRTCSSPSSSVAQNSENPN